MICFVFALIFFFHSQYKLQFILSNWSAFNCSFKRYLRGLHLQTTMKKPHQYSHKTHLFDEVNPATVEQIQEVEENNHTFVRFYWNSKTVSWNKQKGNVIEQASNGCIQFGVWKKTKLIHRQRNTSKREFQRCSAQQSKLIWLSSEK